MGETFQRSKAQTLVSVEAGGGGMVSETPEASQTEVPRRPWGADGGSSVGSGSRGHGGLCPCRLPADSWKLGFELQDDIMVNDAKFWDRLH